MFDLVTKNEQGDLVTTSLAIAEGIGNPHSTVIRLIRDNASDIKEFGLLDFRSKSTGGRPTEFAMLNEQQSTLLLSYMRNNDVVRAFKKRLVRTFFEMRDQLRAQQPSFDLPDFTNPAVAARAWAEQHEQRIAAQQQIERDVPAVRFAHQVKSAEDAISVADAAKLLGTGQQRLFSFLRERQWIDRRNRPYQRAIEAGVLCVKLGSWTHPNHGLQKSVTTIVTPKGIIKLQNIFEAQREPA